MSYIIGDAASDATARSALLLKLDGSFKSWRDQVMAFADSTDDSEGNTGTLRNFVTAAARQFNRFIGGEVAQGQAMQTTMDGAMSLIREINANSSSIPSLQDAYDATGQSIHDLLVSIASTVGDAAGAAAGHFIAAAARGAGVKPADIGAGIGKLTLAVGLVGGAVILTQLGPIIRFFFSKPKKG